MKKAISIAVVVALIVLIFCGPLAQESDAFAASAIIIGAVIAVMAVSGIALVATSGLTAAQLKSYIGSKLDEWAAYKQSTIDHLINTAGIGMTISGLLTVGTAAANGINDFISWLISDEAIQSNTEKIVIQSLGNVITLTTTYQWVCRTSDNYGFQVKIERESDVPIYCILASNNGYFGPICFCSVDTEVAVIWRCFDYPDYNPSQYNQYMKLQEQNYDNFYFGNDYWWKDNYLQYMTYFGCEYVPGWYNAMDYIEQFMDNPSAGTGSLTIDAGVIDINNIGTDDKYFIDVTGVLPGDTVVEATDQIIDNVITGIQPVQDVIVDESEPEYVITGPVAISGLSQVFPFCIPFDIYNFLSALAADPQAPSFEWRFYVPGICDETLEIDLSVFNTVAQILRTMELLAFIVGLAFVTRSRFIRS